MGTIVGSLHGRKGEWPLRSPFQKILFVSLRQFAKMAEAAGARNLVAGSDKKTPDPACFRIALSPLADTEKIASLMCTPGRQPDAAYQATLTKQKEKT